MPGRNGQTGNYRYGFNGMESDDEFKGNENSYTTEYRLFDSRLGRWLSIDPEAALFPSQSPYAFVDNDPLNKLDVKGDRPIPINDLLSLYGYKSREDHLFPEKTLAESIMDGVKRTADLILGPRKGRKGIIDDILFTLETGTEIRKENFQRDMGNSTLPNLKNYMQTLENIEKSIDAELKDVNEKIEQLQKEEAENGTGFNVEEIKSQYKTKYELEDRKHTLEFEKGKLKKAIEKKEAEPDKAGISSGDDKVGVSGDGT